MLTPVLALITCPFAGELVAFDEYTVDQKHSYRHYLKADGEGAELYLLDLGQQAAPSVAPQSRVRVEYSSIDGETLRVSAPIQVLQHGRSLAGLDGVSGPVQPAMLFFIMDFCGKGSGTVTKQVGSGPFIQHAECTAGFAAGGPLRVRAVGKQQKSDVC